MNQVSGKKRKAPLGEEEEEKAQNDITRNKIAIPTRKKRQTSICSKLGLISIASASSSSSSTKSKSSSTSSSSFASPAPNAKATAKNKLRVHVPTVLAGISINIQSCVKKLENDKVYQAAQKIVDTQEMKKKVNSEEVKLLHGPIFIIKFKQNGAVAIWNIINNENIPNKMNLTSTKRSLTIKNVLRWAIETNVISTEHMKHLARDSGLRQSTMETFTKNINKLYNEGKVTKLGRKITLKASKLMLKYIGNKELFNVTKCVGDLIKAYRVYYEENDAAKLDEEQKEEDEDEDDDLYVDLVWLNKVSQNLIISKERWQILKQDLMEKCGRLKEDAEENMATTVPSMSLSIEPLVPSMSSDEPLV